MSDGDWHRLDRRTVWVSAVLLVGVAIGAGVPTTLGIARGEGYPVALAWVLPCAALLVGLGALADFLRWKATTYRISTDRVEVRFNLVMHTSKTLARERVRTVDVTANPLLRMFGLAELTAGTGQGASTQERVKLSPLSRPVAERLRGELLQRDVPQDAESGAAPGTATGAGQPHQPGTLATLDPKWVRYAPVSVVVPTIGVAAFGALMQAADWIGVQGSVLDYVGMLFTELPLPIVLLLLIAAGLVVGVLGSILLFVEFWWNYRLEREPTGTLRVRRGLLTTRSVSIEESRLRGVDLVEPLGNRSLGAGRLDAVATGMRQRENNNKTDYKTLLPAAPRALADRVGADVLREAVAPTSAVRLRGHPAAARGRRVRWALAGVLVVCVGLVLLGWLLTAVLYWVALAAAVLLTPIALLLAVDAYRNLGHGITGAYLVTRSGSVRRSTVALRRSGVIGWTFKQSIFQRRAGLLTVTAVTAAGNGGYDTLDAGEQDGLRYAEEAVPDLLTQFLDRSGGIERSAESADSPAQL